MFTNAGLGARRSGGPPPDTSDPAVSRTLVYGAYAACVLGGAAFARAIPNLVWLTVRAQIVNAFLLPMVVIFLVVLAFSSLPHPQQLRGWYLGHVVIAATLTCACGIFGGIHGLL